MTFPQRLQISRSAYVVPKHPLSLLSRPSLDLHIWFPSLPPPLSPAPPTRPPSPRHTAIDTDLHDVCSPERAVFGLHYRLGPLNAHDRDRRYWVRAVYHFVVEFIVHGLTLCGRSQ